MATLIFIVSVSILGTAADPGFYRVNDSPIQYAPKVTCKDLCKLIPLKDLKEFGSGLDCDVEEIDYDSTQCAGCSTTRSWTKWPLGKIIPKLISNGCFLKTTNSTSVISKNNTAPDNNREAITISTTSSGINKLDQSNQSIEIPLEIDNINRIEKSDVHIPQTSSNSQEDGRTSEEDDNDSNTATPSVYTGTLSPISSTTINITYTRCTKTCYTGSDDRTVCGTDLVTYFNVLRIECAKKCGRNVEVLCEGPCPVCAAEY